MKVLAVDPGTRASGWLLYDVEDGRPIAFGIETNEELAARLRAGRDLVDVVVIEQVESYGMAVGRDVFETVRWAGRFEEASQPAPVVLMPRRTVKVALCGSPRANDANIRAALIDRFGGLGGIASAKGTKHEPGPLHGVSKDVWQALALAVTFVETRP